MTFIGHIDLKKQQEMNVYIVGKNLREHQGKSIAAEDVEKNTNTTIIQRKMK